MSSVPFQRTSAILGVGDIGVATEWRSLVPDWTALLTERGTDIYIYLRDNDDHQRALRPLLTPQGATKRKLQAKLGRRSAASLHGPERLLAVVGLVMVRYIRGAADSEHPSVPMSPRITSASSAIRSSTGRCLAMCSTRCWRRVTRRGKSACVLFWHAASYGATTLSHGSF
jgi:hypothetical protein